MPDTPINDPQAAINSALAPEPVATPVAPPAPPAPEAPAKAVAMGDETPLAFASMPPAPTPAPAEQSSPVTPPAPAAVPTDTMTPPPAAPLPTPEVVPPAPNTGMAKKKSKTGLMVGIFLFLLVGIAGALGSAYYSGQPKLLSEWLINAGIVKDPMIAIIHNLPQSDDPAVNADNAAKQYRDEVLHKKNKDLTEEDKKKMKIVAKQAVKTTVQKLQGANKDTFQGIAKEICESGGGKNCDSGKLTASDISDSSGLLDPWADKIATDSIAFITDSTCSQLASLAAGWCSGSSCTVPAAYQSSCWVEHYQCGGEQGGTVATNGCQTNLIAGGQGNPNNSSSSIIGDCGVEQIDVHCVGSDGACGNTPMSFVSHNNVTQCGTGTNEPNPSPSHSPGASPSGSPTNGLACTGITKAPTTTPAIGTALTFTCAGTITPASAGTLSYKFRYSINDAAPVALTNKTATTAELTIASCGSYKVECQTCATIAGVLTCDPTWTGATQ